MRFALLLLAAAVLLGCSAKLETIASKAEQACIDKGGIPIPTADGKSMQDCKFPPTGAKP